MFCGEIFFSKNGTFERTGVSAALKAMGARWRLDQSASIHLRHIIEIKRAPNLALVKTPPGARKRMRCVSSVHTRKGIS